MKRDAFPELRRFCEGYLHEDFVQEHGTAQGALRAFEEDASKFERRRLAQEAERMLTIVESEDLDEIRRLLAQLGSRWRPPSRAAAMKFLAAAAGSTPPANTN